MYAPQMRSCGSKAYIESPFRMDGAQYIQLGERSVIQARGWIYCAKIENQAVRLYIGSRCVFGYNNHITAVCDVVIEDDVLTANNVFISDNHHGYHDIHTPIMSQPIQFKNSVHIGAGTWIGENVCILGAKIGRNCVIGANSVVTKDIPDYCIAVGSPAKVIRYYDHNKQAWISNSRSE